MPILECNKLTKTYGGVTALDHIDLAIDPGRIVGLLGPNGSGKTTLIKLAAGLLQPTEGQILIDGKAPSPQTNAVLSYLPERIALDPESGRRRLVWWRPALAARWQAAHELRRAALQQLFAAQRLRPLWLEGSFDADALTRYFHG